MNALERIAYYEAHPDEAPQGPKRTRVQIEAEAAERLRKKQEAKVAKLTAKELAEKNKSGRIQGQKANTKGLQRQYLIRNLNNVMETLRERYRYLPLHNVINAHGTNNDLAMRSIENQTKVMLNAIMASPDLPILEARYIGDLSLDDIALQYANNTSSNGKESSSQAPQAPQAPADIKKMIKAKHDQELEILLKRTKDIDTTI